MPLPTHIDQSSTPTLSDYRWAEPREKIQDQTPGCQQVNLGQILRYRHPCSSLIITYVVIFENDAIIRKSIEVRRVYPTACIHKIQFIVALISRNPNSILT